ncbi:MAG: MerR family transcriptional regulator, partial [Myxococcota bacterium]
MTAAHEEERTGDASGGAFGVQEVADLLATTPARVRGWVRAGLVEPTRGARGALRFSFRDLTFLRRVNDLEGQRITPRRVRRVIRRLRDAGARDLSGLDARRGEIVLREGDALVSPESGQVVFDFSAP